MGIDTTPGLETSHVKLVIGTLPFEADILKFCMVYRFSRLYFLWLAESCLSSSHLNLAGYFCGGISARLRAFGLCVVLFLLV